MKYIFIILGGVLVFLNSCNRVDSSEIFTTLRAPAYPLITIDPYTSAWSTSDTLYETAIKHWTGKDHPLIGAIRVDGEVYRFLGKEKLPMKAIIPPASHKAWSCLHTRIEPKEGWQELIFNDKSWKQGKGAFGTHDRDAVSTFWNNGEIWIRREFTISEEFTNENLLLYYAYDDDFELYLNGHKIANAKCCSNESFLQIDKNRINFGEKNVIAAHCIDNGGSAYVDFGIMLETKEKEVFRNTAIQESVELSATQSQYKFTCGPVNLKLSFVSPLLPENLDLLSRPINYINYEVYASDNKEHDVQVYFDATPQWAVNSLSQEVLIDQGESDRLQFTKAGTTEQPVLQKKGDDLRIDWGYFYLGVGKSKNQQVAIGENKNSKRFFAGSGSISPKYTMYKGKMTQSMPAMVCVDSLGLVGKKPKSAYIVVAYDDIESIQYFNTNLKAWWKKGGELSMEEVLDMAVIEHNQIMDKCNEFDNRVMNDALDAGGEKYADLCVLAYRQSVAAHKLVKDTTGNILFLSKENNSNGSIGTVDVTYPSAPLFLKYNPELLKGMLNPIFYYSESGKWTKPFAAHDVGTYPIANGQTYGGDMPVEECGNMLILTAAIAAKEGNAKYALKHWGALTTWAEYLLKNGLDPENQLCTDDFAGHFAHNANLSAKAIMGIACYGQLASKLEKNKVAEKYRAEATAMAKEWMRLADDGDHYRLTFDQAGTWSQKYNLVWDKLLGLNIFPDEVVSKELAYYLKKQNKYGLPLDNRRTYSKSDWIVWTATLADNQEIFKQIIEPLHLFISETPDRVPMTDWYETTDATQIGFKARSVVGGYFIKMLEPEFIKTK